MGESLGPLGWEADGAPGGHLDERKHLAGLDDQCLVAAAANLECAPKAHALDGLETAMDYEDIAQYGGFPVIDLRADDDRVLLALGHGAQAHADLLGQQRAGDLDEAQIGDIVDHGSAVRVEEHDLRFRLDRWRFHRDWLALMGAPRDDRLPFADHASEAPVNRQIVGVNQRSSWLSSLITGAADSGAMSMYRTS
jgi:hypothetical protein